MPIYSIGGKRPQVAEESWIAPTATLIGDVEIGKNSSIWWNSVIRADNDKISIGENTNIQDNCILHADPGIPLTLGDNVTIGHMVMLHGCTVGENSLIGIKSVILNHVVIGKECLIGANTLIPEGKVIPDRSLVVGSPGKVIRTLTDEDVLRLKRTAAHYVENWQRYSDTLELIE